MNINKELKPEEEIKIIRNLEEIGVLPQPSSRKCVNCAFGM